MKTMNDSTLLGGCYGCRMCGGLLNLTDVVRDVPGFGVPVGNLEIGDLTKALMYYGTLMLTDPNLSDRNYYKSMYKKVENVLNKMSEGYFYNSEPLKKDLNKPEPDLYAVLENEKRKKRNTKPKERIITTDCYARPDKNGKWMRWVDGKLATRDYYNSVCEPDEEDNKPPVGPRQRKTGKCRELKNSRGRMMRYVDGKLVKKDYYEAICGNNAQSAPKPVRKTKSQPAPKGKNKGKKTKHTCTEDALRDMIANNRPKKEIDNFIRSCYNRHLNANFNPIGMVGATTLSSYNKKKKN